MKKLLKISQCGHIIKNRNNHLYKRLADNDDRNSTLATAKYTRVVFLYEKRYWLIKMIKISNARMNIPKAIRSLKSNLIRTTSHLCRMEGQHLAVT